MNEVVPFADGAHRIKWVSKQSISYLFGECAEGATHKLMHETMGNKHIITARLLFLKAIPAGNTSPSPVLIRDRTK